MRCPRHVDHHLGGNRLGACIFGVGRSSETAETALDLAQTAAAIAIKIVAIIARKHKAQTISAVLDAGKGHPVVAEFGATLQADCLWDAAETAIWARNAYWVAGDSSWLARSVGITVVGRERFALSLEHVVPSLADAIAVFVEWVLDVVADIAKIVNYQTVADARGPHRCEARVAEAAGSIPLWVGYIKTVHFFETVACRFHHEKTIRACTRATRKHLALRATHTTEAIPERTAVAHTLVPCWRPHFSRTAAHVHTCSSIEDLLGETIRSSTQGYASIAIPLVIGGTNHREVLALSCVTVGPQGAVVASHTICAIPGRSIGTLNVVDYTSFAVPECVDGACLSILNAGSAIPEETRCATNRNAGSSVINLVSRTKRRWGALAIQQCSVGWADALLVLVDQRSSA